MNIHLLGDLHGGEDAAAFERYLWDADPEDLLILLGDVSLAFDGSERNRAFTERFLALPHRIAIVDGNHENHPFLRSFPEETAFGGRVHRLSGSIVYLKRGEIFEIGGHSFFVMGGCKSSRKWKEMGLCYAHEDPDEQECAAGRAALAARGNCVDFILTHKYIGSWTQPPQCPLEHVIAHLDAEVDFSHWYSAHFHRNEVLDERHTVVFDRLVTIPAKNC